MGNPGKTSSEARDRVASQNFLFEPSGSRLQIDSWPDSVFKLPVEVVSG